MGLNTALVRKLLSLLLSLVLPAMSAVADSGSTSSAMLHTTGSVTINGAATSNSSAVMVGDSIQTNESSSGVISSSGTMINVLPNSEVKYRGNVLDVDGGTVEVSTTSGLSVSANSFTVMPQQGSVKFQITRTGFCGSVTVLQGSVVVTNGKTRNVVEQGNSVAIDDARCAKVAAVPGGGASSPVNAPSVSKGAIATAVGVAGVSACVILCRDRQRVSESQPR